MQEECKVEYSRSPLGVGVFSGLLSSEHLPLTLRASPRGGISTVLISTTSLLSIHVTDRGQAGANFHCLCACCLQTSYRTLSLPNTLLHPTLIDMMLLNGSPGEFSTSFQQALGALTQADGERDVISNR